MRAATCFPFALLLFALPVGPAAAADAPARSVDFVKGYSWGWMGYRGEYLGPAAERSMQALADTGTRWIALAFAAHVRNRESTEILYGDANRQMVSDDEIRRAVGLARARGMKVMLKPVVNSRDGTWRAEIAPDSPDDWQRWWASYEAFVLHYASIAADERCEMLCVGCEMRAMEPFAERWRQLIDKVRRVYHGPIVYNANHDDVHRVTWFDAVDIIGISAYYPVSTEGDTSLEKMLDGWRPVREKLAELNRRWDRPILFAEIGVCSARGLSATPWAPARRHAVYDGREQARFYEAAFRTFADAPWMIGYFWWDWKARLYDRDEAEGRTDFCIHGKPAEAVLRRWYAKER